MENQDVRRVNRPLLIRFGCKSFEHGIHQGTGYHASLPTSFAPLRLPLGDPAHARRRSPDLLPDLLPYEELLTTNGQQPESRLVPIGVNEDALAPVYLDFDAEPHFMAFMDGESGKTNLLRSCQRVSEVTQRRANRNILVYKTAERSEFGSIIRVWSSSLPEDHRSIHWP